MTTSTRQREAQVPLVVAALLNLVLLGLPFVVFGRLDRISTDSQAILFMLLVTAWCLLEGTAHSGRPQQLYRLNKASQWLPLVVSVTVLLIFWASAAERSSGGHAFDVVTALGCAAMLAGIVLRTLAVRTLKGYFLDEIVLLPGQPLVTHGVYGWLRHPSETGTLCIGFGSAILLGSLFGLGLCAFVLLPTVVVRVRLEDAMLARTYQEEFSAYVREVLAFSPLPPRFGRWMRAIRSRHATK